MYYIQIFFVYLHKQKTLRVMKTQINTLVNGAVPAKIARVDDKAAQQPGSSFEERATLKRRVEEENPTVMKVKLYGVEVELAANISCSGRNNGWSAIISEKEAEAILGYIPTQTYQINYELTVDANLMVEISWAIRRNERCEWKPSGYLFIREKNITIL